jgi:hypothetical protein
MAEQEYSVPAPVVQEHYYLQAAVIELQRLRAAVENLTATLTRGATVEHEVTLKEPAVKPKARHRDEALSMVEPVPQDDPVSLVEVEPEPEMESKPKPKRG